MFKLRGKIVLNLGNLKVLATTRWFFLFNCNLLWVTNYADNL